MIQVIQMKQKRSLVPRKQFSLDLRVRLSAVGKINHLSDSGDLQKSSRGFQHDLSPARKRQVMVFPRNCVRTTYKRSVQRRYRLSRFMIRERGLKGKLPGVKKL